MPQSLVPHISVVIVNYHADALVRALQKILAKDNTIECIVIDNSDGQRGYGAGCNLGVQASRAEYVVCMNPDITLQSTQDLHKLCEILVQNPQFGMVGPQIRSTTNEVQITCSAVPSPWQAVLLYSFLGKLPILSHIHRWYRLGNFRHQISRVVPSINGSCFAFRKQDFQAIGGCDEQLFLYFEEFDLALRMKKMLNKEVFFYSGARVRHSGQQSTNQRSTNFLKQTFTHSRRHWLHKHYGFSGKLAALFLELTETRFL